jgi:hypothetical protein
MNSTQSRAKLEPNSFLDNLELDTFLDFIEEQFRLKQGLRLIG